MPPAVVAAEAPRRAEVVAVEPRAALGVAMVGCAAARLDGVTNMAGIGTPLIVVVGPTGAGKTSLAIEIAGWFDGEVVSADAFQIYRGLDIGTGKVSADETRGIAHHCIDIADPSQSFSAVSFARAATAAIDGITKRSHQPVVAGGSGFYLRALIDGLAPLPTHDPAWRKALQAIEARRGLPHLFAMLEVLDPEWAERVGAADRQRILRALEVTLRLGEPISRTLQRDGWTGPHYDAMWIGLTWPRERLYERIGTRVDAMLKAGWVAEVERLISGGLSPRAPGLRAIGYRELARHVGGEIELEAARDEIVRATRRYAKRQLTWFRKQTPATWFIAETACEPLYPQIRAHLVEKLACYTPGSMASEHAH